MIIKALLIIGIAGATIYALRARPSSTRLAIRRLTAVAFVGVATLSVMLPGAITWVAQLVGVHRGTDLLLYALIVAFLFVTIGLYQRIHSLNEKLTQLTRELALRTPKPPEQSSSATESQSAA